MRRAAIFVPLAFAVTAPVAHAQADRRAAAHATIATVLNSLAEGGETPLGFIPDLLTYSATGSGCRTDIRRTQRPVTRGNRVMSTHFNNQIITWADVDSVVRATVSNARSNPNGVLIRAKNGVQLLYGLNSAAAQARLLDAMETLREACEPGNQPVASRPVAPPRPVTPPPSTPAATSRFAWEDRKTEWCKSDAVRGLNLFPGHHATLQRAATGFTSASRLILSQPLPGSGGRPLASTPPTAPMQNSFIVQSLTGTGQARIVTLAFDGRPAGFTPEMADGRYGTSNSRTIYLPADFADRLATVAKVTLTLKLANGVVLNTYNFDVADVRLMRAELVRANWSCRDAR